MTTTAIYTRISNDPKLQGLGVQRQLDDCLDLAGRLGWEVVARYDDNDMSAYSGKRRPGFEAMLTAMKRREFGALICWHTDRLYRSMKDLERLIDIAESNQTQLRTVQSGELDLSTSAGRMIARILGSVARQESEHKGERHRRANAQKAAAGKWQTTIRAFGYGAKVGCRDDECGCGGYHDVGIPGQPLEPEASMIRQAAADVLLGKSLRSIARDWNAAGVTGTKGNSWAATSVRRVLMRPRNAGLRTYHDKIVAPGDWPAIIDVDTYHGLVAYLSNPGRVVWNPSFERKYIGSSVYICGVCGSKMCHSVRGRSEGRSEGTRGRYECKAKQCVARIGAPLDAFVEQTILDRLSSPNAIDLVTYAEIDSTEAKARRVALQARLDELAGLFAAGDIDASQLTRGSTDLRTQIADIDSLLGILARKSPTADLLAAGENVREHWAELSADRKGKIIDELCTVIVNKAPCGTRFNSSLIEIRWHE